MPTTEKELELRVKREEFEERTGLPARITIEGFSLEDFKEKYGNTILGKLSNINEQNGFVTLNINGIMNCSLLYKLNQERTAYEIFHEFNHKGYH